MKNFFEINRALAAKKIKTITAILLALACTGCAKKSSQATEENVDVTKIYNLVILDRSGSMTPLREVTISGYNEILDVIRLAQQQHYLEQQNLVSLVLFNHVITDVFDCDTIQNIPNLLWDNYVPEGATAMYDAIGVSLTKLRNKLDSLQNATAVVTIISDGMENYSSTYNLKQVAKLIDSLKKQGVMFVFMGTNQNVAMTASSLHIDDYKAFVYTTEGMRDAWEQSMKASADYYDRMSQYNKDTRGMTWEERHKYFRDRNRENTWFERINKKNK